MEYGDKSREEIVTGKPPVEAQPAELDVNSREFHAKHGWPDTEAEEKAKAEAEEKAKATPVEPTAEAPGV